ncbi:MAG: DUF362 domain-containing protein [Bacteroidota bacterium]
MSEAVVTICTDEKATAQSLLAATLAQAGFWEQLEKTQREKKIATEAFRILIKPDFGFYELNGTTGTDPALAEHLVTLLAKKGYRQVTIADGENGAGVWLENRDIHSLADLAGYKYETPDGIPYEIQSLSESPGRKSFDAASVLKDTSLSQHWHDTDFRIVFAKNKTDEEFYYSLGLKCLMDILPQKAKYYHHYFRSRPEEVAAALLERNEVDFCIIDAYTSNHGMQGDRHSKPLSTCTFIAGKNILLTDWAAALKMGLDPYCSSINSYALKKYGLPKKYKVNGDLTVYDGWQNVPRLLAESVQSRNKNPVIRQLSQAWLQTIDTDIFPFKNMADAQVNKFIAPVVKNIDEHPLAYTALVSLNYLLAGMQNFIDSWNTLYNKEKLVRQQTELGFDVKEFSTQDFEDIENYITPLVQIVENTVPDKNGLKWRYIDESVLFEFSRTLPYDYTAFVEKVDIANAVQYMFDNIGGIRVPVKTNRKGEIIYQAERDIYLPQPNWMTLFGGKPIDVCKIEVLRYTSKSRAIYWRTVKSINQSADFDDGMVSFSAVQKGITEIKIVARQKFGLPLFWKVINIDYVPKVKDAMVSNAYIQFFSRTIANFEAAYEGRNPQVGKVPDAAWGEHTPYDHPLQAEQFKNVFAFFSGIAEKWMGKRNAEAGHETTGEEDDGYRHFEGNKKSKNDPAVVIRSFITDLSGTLKKDIDYITGSK